MDYRYSVWTAAGKFCLSLARSGLDRHTCAMKRDVITDKILQDTARRFGLTVPAQIDLDSFGARPRLGQILDHYDPAKVQAGSVSFTVGPYEFRPDEGVLHHDGASIRLTGKESGILLLLLQAEGGRVDRADLLDKVWGYVDGVETHTLETHIYRLRQKIEPDPAKPSLLLTDGDGYRLSV